MRRFVEVTSRVKGSHYWKNAEEPVRFLASEHRHTFHIRARVSVKHGDRDVEFVLLKTEIHNFFTDQYSKQFDPTTMMIRFAGKSCEMLAEEIYGWLIGRGYHPIEVAVGEDGEFWGIVNHACPQDCQTE